MSRRTATPEELDVSQWATIMIDRLSSREAEIVRKREKALRLYTAFEPLALIKRVTGIGRAKMIALFDRALAPHADGRPQGFRACLYYARVKNYTRTAKAPRSGGRGGHGGMFKAFLIANPIIASELRRYLNKGPRGGLKEASIRPKEFYKEFLRLCVESGIAEDKYPFTTDSKADRSVERLLDEWLKEDHLAFAQDKYGKDVARKLGTGASDPKVAYHAYQRWDFDGHKIDGLFTILRCLPDGKLSVELLKRIWILAIRDWASAAIVGHHLVLRTEYNSEDVLTCFENAVLPWKRKALTISGLGYPDDGGLPSGCIPELAYAYANEVAWDTTAP